MFIDKNGVVRMPKAYLAGTEFFTPTPLKHRKNIINCAKSTV